MADLKENLMATITAAYLRCLDSAGNSGVIDIISFLESNTVISGNKTTGNTDCLNDAPGVYRVYPAVTNLPSDVSGTDSAIYVIFVVDNVIRATILYNDTNKKLYIGLTWSTFRGWRSITIS